MFSKAQVIQETMVPYLPPKVEKHHIGLNGKLLTEEAINWLKSNFTQDGIYTKPETKLKYMILVYSGKYFAIYLGKKHKKYGEFGKALGVGGCGAAKLIQDLDTGTWLGCKIQTPLLVATNEVNMLERVGHLTPIEINKNLITFTRMSKSQKSKKHYTLLNLARGINLFDLYISEKKLPLINQLEIIIKMVQAVKNVYEKGILHCDIKPENMVYDPVSGEVVLLDFGLAREMNEEGKAKGKLSGTRSYLAPELLKKTCEYSMATEIYSLGLTIGVFLGLVWQQYGTCFLVAKNSYAYNELYEENTRIPDAQVKFTIWKTLKLMVDECPGLRPDSFEDIISHFTNVKNKLAPQYKTIKIGILDVDEYEIIQQNKNYIENLSNVDEIWLAQKNKDKDPWFYSGLRNDLIRQGLFVSDKLLHHSEGKAFIHDIPDNIKAKNPEYIYDLYHIKPNEILPLVSPVITNTNSSDKREINNQNENINYLASKNIRMFSGPPVIKPEENDRVVPQDKISKCHI